MKKRHHKIIILDFDHTIFNTTAYVERLQKNLEKAGISKNEFWDKRQSLKDCCHLVDIDQFVDSLEQENKSALHDVIHETIEQYAQEFIFSDVNGFITQHKDNFDFLILTQGDEELQTKKIKHSNLPTYVSYKIVKDKKVLVIGDVIDLYDEVIFIDDKAKNIDDIKKAYSTVETYFLQRPEDKPYAHISSTCACVDHVVMDLRFVL